MGTPWTNSQRVRGYLHKHDVPCPGRGYSLRGLEKPVCPECGRRLFINDLLPPNPYTHQWRAFRVLVFVIGVPLTGAVVLVLVYTFPSWLKHRKGGALLVAPVWIPLIMNQVLSEARTAYENKTWPKFIRSTLQTLALLGGLLGAGALAVWVGLKFYP